jgi:hypothetical protein
MDGDSCCSPVLDTATLHTELSELLTKYDVNAAAASVKVYAVKPKAKTNATTSASCCGPSCCA